LRLKDGRGFNTDRLPGVVMDAKSPDYIDRVVSDVRGSFAMSQALVDEPSLVDAALIELQRLQGKRTRGRKRGFF
jgi:hypothetical protein